MYLLTCLSLFILNTSIYNLQFQDIDGNTVAMSQYQGKKILLVNIATGSNKVSQLAGLQQLQQQFADSLVVIGFPSNSFGNETRNDAQIKQFCQSGYGVSFKLAAKNPIAGILNQPVYSWLTTMGENGVTNDPVKGDFQKYLISESGNLIGYFSPKVDPLDQQIIQALHIQ